jgi:hypothetical protein
MFEDFIATCFGSFEKVHHEANKIQNESYVKHFILFYSVGQASYINRYKNTKSKFV